MKLIYVNLYSFNSKQSDGLSGEKDHKLHKKAQIVKKTDRYNSYIYKL